MKHSSSEIFATRETPRSRYESDLQRKDFTRDAAQHAAVDHLEALCAKLTETWEADARTSKVSKAFSRLAKRVTRRSATPIKGLYFWGGVGRGKTYLMDIFYDCLPFEQKMRTHFHRFMKRVHHELKQLKDQQDPLEHVAKTLAGEVRVICFDEFFVSDITDAMILANLLRALFDRGVTLVATSNIEPSGLYRDGLQRARFLPAIDLLNTHTQVVNVDGGVDYRLRTLEKTTLYHCPLGPEAHASMLVCFERLVPDEKLMKENVSIEIEGRSIHALKEADDVVWFDFKALCDGPRSQNDYIELAREYHAVMVENIPVLGAHNDDQAKRFVFLVDEFYDRNVKLVLSAEKPITSLYGNGRLNFEFQRTVSRLQEMQSITYLEKAHKA